jgi:hypothetical protein
MLALDPGGTTGVAIFDYEHDSAPVMVMNDQIPGSLDGFIEWYLDRKPKYDWDHVVCEDFTLRLNVKFPDLSPVYIIGALNAIEWDVADNLTMQQPSMKSLCDDSRLKKMALHTPGFGHANDAVRHAIIYLRNKKHMPTLRLGWASEESEG